MDDIGRFAHFRPDYNLLSPDDMDDLLFNAYDQALGEETRERLRKEFSNYQYYDGKQHQDEYGNLVDADELERPPGLDYDPTRYATNYFKAIVDRKARWQMGGDHSVHVPREQLDDELAVVSDGYEPSGEQRKENERAENYEDLLKKLWRQNNMRSKLVQAARDRLIADRVVCKIVFNQRTGQLRWIWRPDTEFIPIYSDDDFEEMVACHFVRQMIVERKGKEVEAVRKQTFELNDDRSECYLSEAIYDVNTLDMIKEIEPKTPMNLDFLPVVEIPVNKMLGGDIGDGEVSQLREQNDVLNQMNEDAIDSLKFEMFSITALINASEGTAAKMKVAPGAVMEARSASEGQSPDVKKVEGGFRWKESFKDQYSRVKGAMHEVSGLPQIVPQELNFGGLNGEALQILFHDIISDTEEHWMIWQQGLQELHEKSIKYLQARTREDNFDYDKDQVRSVKDYRNEIKLQLPLPDNRKEKVDLLTSEITEELESHKGAMERLGVDNVQAKMKEIEVEKQKERENEDPYGEASEDDDDEDGGLHKEDGELKGGSRGDERMITCPECGGSGKVSSEKTGETITCPTCGGEGVVQARKR